MDNIVIFLNSTGRWFVSFSAAMLIQSGALIVLLVLLDLLIRKKVRAVVRYWIWMLVLVKLVLPPTLSLPTGAGYWFGDRLPTISTGTAITAEEPGDVRTAVEPAATDTVERRAPAAPTERGTFPRSVPSAGVETDRPSAVSGPASTMTWQGFAFLGWIATVAAIMLLLIQRIFFVRGLIAQSKEASERMAATLQAYRRQIGVRRDILFKLSPLAASPSVCGLIRPVILVPLGLAEKLDRRQLKSVLLHELAHIKRGDLWVSLVQTILQIVYIYNPLLWAANAIIRKIREQAVDEMVLATMGEEAEDYPQTLLDVSRLTFSRPALSLRLVGVVESKKALTGRIKHILNRPFPKTAKLGMVGLIVVIGVGCVLLPMAKRERTMADKVDAGQKEAAAQVKIRKVIDSFWKAVEEQDADAVRLLAPIDYIFGRPDYSAEKRIAKLREERKEALEKGFSFKDLDRIHVDADRHDALAITVDKGPGPLFYYLQEIEGKWIIQGFDDVPKSMKVQELFERCRRNATGDKTNTGAAAEKAKEKSGWKDAAAKWAGQGKLGLHVLPNRTHVEGLHEVIYDDQRKEYIESLAKKGPGAREIAGDICVWYQAGCELPDGVIVETCEEKKYVLVGRWYAVGKDSLHGEEAELVDARAVKDSGSNWAVEFELSSGAHTRMQRLAEDYAGHYVAVAVDGNVISTFTLTKEIDAKQSIRGALGKEQAEVLAAALKAGNPAIGQLIGAIEGGNLEAVKKLVERNAELLDTTHKQHRTNVRPLFHAVVYNRTEIARYLLEKGADVNAKVEGADAWNRGETALHRATAYSGREMVELLLSFGADINALDGQGMTPLARGIAQRGPEETKDTKEKVALLVEHGADVNAKGAAGLSPLSAAILYKGLCSYGLRTEKMVKADAQESLGNLEVIIKLLLARGAEEDIFAAAGLGDTQRISAILKTDLSMVNSPKWMGLTPLHMAVTAGHQKAARLLIENGADIFVRCDEGSALELAARLADLKMLKMLDGYCPESWRLGSDKKDNFREAMFKAASEGHAEIVEYLFGSRTTVNAKSEYGETVLHQAAGAGRSEVVRLLLARGADVNNKTRDGTTALHETVLQTTSPGKQRDGQNYIETLNLLINAGANVNAKNRNDETPLLRAASVYSSQTGWPVNIEVFKLLIKHGADVNVRRRGEGTALIHAAKANKLELAKILLEAGADPYLDTDGPGPNELQRALDFAEQHKDGEMVRLLRKYMNPTLDDTNKSIETVVKSCLRAIRDEDDEALMKVAVDHPHYQPGIWKRWAAEIRKDYQGHFELFDNLTAGKFYRGWADAFVPRPPGDQDKFTVFTLMEFPDGRWRVIQHLKRRYGPEVIAGERAKNAIEFLNDYRAKVFDAAGKSENVPVRDKITGGIPPKGRIVVTVRAGNLRFEFPDEPEYPIVGPVEVHKDLVKNWRREELKVAKSIQLKRGDTMLEAKEGKATLSGPGRNYVIDVHAGKVRVQFEQQVLEEDRFAFGLPLLELQGR